VLNPMLARLIAETGDCFLFDRMGDVGLAEPADEVPSSLRVAATRNAISKAPIWSLADRDSVDPARLVRSLMGGNRRGRGRAGASALRLRAGFCVPAGRRWTSLSAGSHGCENRNRVPSGRDVLRRASRRSRLIWPQWRLAISYDCFEVRAIAGNCTAVVASSRALFFRRWKRFAVSGAITWMKPS
jgi:hypothetical protein